MNSTRFSRPVPPVAPTPPLATARWAGLATAALTLGCGPALLGSSLSDDSEAEVIPVATAPSPENGAEALGLLVPELEFTWTPAPFASAQRLSLALDPGSLFSEDALLTSELLLGTTDRFDLAAIPIGTSALPEGSEIFWRIDAIFDELKVPGSSWSFSTETLGRREVEPNGSTAEANTFLNGKTLVGEIASSPGSEDVDWFRFAMNSGSAYQLRFSAHGFDQQRWRTANAVPEVTIYRTGESPSEPPLPIHQHLWSGEAFTTTATSFYPAVQDLDFPLLSTEQPEVFLVRVRAVNFDSSGTEPSAVGGQYALRLDQLEGGMEYESVFELPNAENLPGAALDGFQNDYSGNATPFTLEPTDEAGRYIGRCAGYLVVEEKEGLLLGGFDYLKTTMPLEGHIYELTATLHATRLGRGFDDPATPVICDLDMNLFVPENNGFSNATAAQDVASFQANDPGITMIREPTFNLDLEAIFGLLHSGHGGIPIDRDAQYTRRGVPYILDVAVTDHTELGLQTELELPGEELNGSPVAAEPLEPGSLFRGNLLDGAGDDSDWLAFAGSAGDRLSCQLWNGRILLDLAGSPPPGSGPGPASEPRLTLFDISDPLTPVELTGIVNTTDEEYDPLNDNARLFLQTILPVDGTYALRVDDPSGLPADEGFDYLLCLDQITGQFESEPNGNLGFADEFAPGQPISGVLDDAAGDVDLFRFTAEQDEVLWFDATASLEDANILEPERPGFGSSAILELAILNNVGIQIASATTLADAGGYPVTSQCLVRSGSSTRLGFLCPASGTYYLSVRDRDNTTGPDHLYVVELEREPLESQP